MVFRLIVYGVLHTTHNKNNFFHSSLSPFNSSQINIAIIKSDDELLMSGRDCINTIFFLIIYEIVF